jgi:hypothetical protein
MVKYCNIASTEDIKSAKGPYWLRASFGPCLPLPYSFFSQKGWMMPRYISAKMCMTLSKVCNEFWIVVMKTSYIVIF